MGIIVDSHWLQAHMDEETIRIIDVRYSLQQPTEGYEKYCQSHISKASFLDVEKDLSNKVDVHGGRHPLPDVESFIATLEKSGISNENLIVIYDGGTGEFASRCFWLLTYIGLENVKILNGGYAKWVSEKRPTNHLLPSFEKGNITAAINHHMHISYEQLIENMKHQDILLIDAREKDRYLGIREPIDKKAGHIPGAIHHFWKDNFTKENWKDVQQLEDQFKHIAKDTDIVVYCGSGITATPNYIALIMAGFQNVKLYAGSFSDWISYDDNKIESEQSIER